MKNKNNSHFTEEWELYEKGKDYNYSVNLYENVNTFERFYRGEQWDNVQSNGLPTPVFNIFRRIISYFVSSIMQTSVRLRYRASSNAEKQGKAVKKLNSIADARWERCKMNDL
ncbi:MAG: hypothetical protein J6Q72_05545, partial [Clostridia bacterium]|nr:hypothetical protein [Clostridia bacterium]